jgi:hypothetical protein
MTWHLEIGSWELSRTHWAVKKADLLAAVRAPPNEAAATAPPYDSKRTTTAAEVAALTLLAPERDLEAVARPVRDAIERNEPAAGLDRLHTFVSALVRSLCEKRGIATPPDKPLHLHVRRVREEPPRRGSDRV